MRSHRTSAGPALALVVLVLVSGCLGASGSSKIVIAGWDNDSGRDLQVQIQLLDNRSKQLASAMWPIDEGETAGSGTYQELTCTDDLDRVQVRLFSQGSMDLLNTETLERVTCKARPTMWDLYIDADLQVALSPTG